MVHLHRQELSFGRRTPGRCPPGTDKCSIPCFWCTYAHQFHCIEWIKGLLAVPFVLYSQPTGVFDGKGFSQAKAQQEAHRRYSEILRDVEFMIDDYSKWILATIRVS